jgi:hypothetical protein
MIGAIPEDKIPMLFGENGDTLPYQVDDLDGDDRWDELFFLCSIKANSSQKIFFSFIDTSAIPVFPKRANVQFIKADPPFEEITTAERLKSTDTDSASAAFYMEGPVWENDIVGFRNYFDARNGMDIFGKKVTRMVFGDTSLVHQDYHQMQAWGMDILKVANSLGAGAIGMGLKNQYYRLDSADNANFRLIADGPIRAVIQLNFTGWKVEDRSYDVMHQISIWGGANCYESKIIFSGLKGDEELISGIVKLHSDSLMIDWENESFVIAATYDKQGFLGEFLGMGILMNSQDYIDTISAPEEGEGIIQSYIIKLKPMEMTPVKFRFYAGWEYQNPDFSDRGKFMEMLKSERDKMASPLIIKGI